MKQIEVLIVEDSVYSADLNVRVLRKAGFTIQHKVVASKKAMQKALADKQWDVILSDNNMRGFNALQALEVRNQSEPLIPFVIVSEDIKEGDLRKATEWGCNAYISKENLDELGQLVAQMLKV